MQGVRRDRVFLFTVGPPTPVTGVEADATRPRPRRALCLSSQVKSPSVLVDATREDVAVLHYPHEATSLSDILARLREAVGEGRFDSVAFIARGTPGQLNLSRDVVLSATLLGPLAAQLRALRSVVVDNGLGRLDILASPAAAGIAGEGLQAALAAATGLKVFACAELPGLGDSGAIAAPSPAQLTAMSISNEYFYPDKIRHWAGPNVQTLAEFEKIRVVGKGAYGSAVLYRKRDDGSFVILKEINLIDMPSSERQLALNEAKVLAMLDHPNIVSYYDCFEQDGMLQIEMEYADGGSLDQLLKSRDNPLPEKFVLALFQQMVLGLQYIHAKRILHRDLKTQNVFLTRDSVVKIGDFGISKVVTATSKQADTVIGTPHYISPELCQGMPYDQKSDIWAMGCILYEMATLKKTFDGSNLPALVIKIMKGDFAPINGPYSDEFKQLIRHMLSQDPRARPTCTDLLMHPLLAEISSVDDIGDMSDTLAVPAPGRLGKRSPRNIRAANARAAAAGAGGREGALARQDAQGDGPSGVADRVSSVFFWEAAATAPAHICFGLEVLVEHVAIGSGHVLAATSEGYVFGWGDNTFGQLGLGDAVNRANPTINHALTGKSIRKVVCGGDFSACISDNGLLQTFGRGENGCLGHGDTASHFKPQLVQELLSVEVADIAAGATHVAIVTGAHEVYAWGHSTCGALGLGADEKLVLSPQRAILPPDVQAVDVTCGIDATVIFTSDGQLYACGSNTFNKIGLNARFGVLRGGRTVDEAWTFTKVNAVGKGGVVAVALGTTSSVVAYDSGKCFTLGSSRASGDVGLSRRSSNMPASVKAVLSDHHVRAVACGSSFTLATAACTPHCSCAVKAPLGGPRVATVFGWGTGLAARCGGGALDDTDAPTVLQLVDNPANIDVVDIACFGQAIAVLVRTPRDAKPAVAIAAAAAAVVVGPVLASGEAQPPPVSPSSLSPSSAPAPPAPPAPPASLSVGLPSPLSLPSPFLPPLPAAPLPPIFPPAIMSPFPPTLANEPAVTANPDSGSASVSSSAVAITSPMHTWLREELRLAAADAIKKPHPPLPTPVVRKVASKVVNVQLDAELIRARKSMMEVKATVIDFRRPSTVGDGASSDGPGAAAGEFSAAAQRRSSNSEFSRPPPFVPSQALRASGASSSAVRQFPPPRRPSKTPSVNDTNDVNVAPAAAPPATAASSLSSSPPPATTASPPRTAAPPAEAGAAVSPRPSLSIRPQPPTAATTPKSLRAVIPASSGAVAGRRGTGASDKAFPPMPPPSLAGAKPFARPSVVSTAAAAEPLGTLEETATLKDEIVRLRQELELQKQVNHSTMQRFASVAAANTAAPKPAVAEKGRQTRSRFCAMM